ncbi:interleukin-12 receptor subunit beta-2 isoform X1 [Channa argus]|uniref:interleukin-12 receptor subunit beta-2 isoform X1 n=1 Tax=Channa argus TaxID=215402 RepID=UPI003521B9DB
MATMSQICPIFTAVFLLALQLCIGNKSCTIWSSSGHMVKRGSSFQVYCTFYCTCKRSMYSDHPPTPQNHEEFNSTTIYFKVLNITENRTYSCQCSCSLSLDSCGMDISTGYPPDRPKDISCIYKVSNDKSGDVFCTWKRGRNTHLKTTSVLCVRSVFGNHTSIDHECPRNGTDLSSVSFPVPRSVQLISVRVKAHNPLGSSVSSTTNYTLSDIAMPPAPVLVHPECSSRECIIRVHQSVKTDHLEIQYKSDGQTWTTFTSPSHSHQGAKAWNISLLEPYTLYNFQARSKLSTGLWSQWSTNISSWTQEEAPAKELDVWYAEPASDSKSLKVYWKEANNSISRGKITRYIVKVYNPNSTLRSESNIKCNATNYTVPFCANCEVAVLSSNSKGLSPPAKITTSYKQAKPPQDLQVTAASDNVTISWRKPEAAPASYVVEWYPEGHKLEELRWVRLSGNDNHTLITGIKQFECYEVAVYVFYDENSVGRTRFTGVTNLESAPAASPLFQEKVEGNAVTVSWTELPRSQRKGCITNYTIYLDSDSRPQMSYNVQASERMYIIEALSPASYSLWMTAWTAKGEGPAGQKVKLYIQQSQLPLLLMCGVISMIVLFFVCLCQNSGVKQRLWVFLQCLILDVVPDPANSKWAKECTQVKVFIHVNKIQVMLQFYGPCLSLEFPLKQGKLNLQVQLSSSSVTKDEEEPILVDVEELPKKNSLTSIPTKVSLQHPSQTSQNPEMDPATHLYPLTTYIKSFSHDSDSSDHTQTSLDTNTTVEYISSHGPGIIAEEDQGEDEEEEEEFPEMLGFLPSHNVFLEPMDFGGKLTLDAVKIDCGDFFQNI